MFLCGFITLQEPLTLIHHADHVTILLWTWFWTFLNLFSHKFFSSHFTVDFSFFLPRYMILKDNIDWSPWCVFLCECACIGRWGLSCDPLLVSLRFINMITVCVSDLTLVSCAPRHFYHYCILSYCPNLHSHILYLLYNMWCTVWFRLNNGLHNVQYVGCPWHIVHTLSCSSSSCQWGWFLKFTKGERTSSIWTQGMLLLWIVYPRLLLQNTTERKSNYMNIWIVGIFAADKVSCNFKANCRLDGQISLLLLSSIWKSTSDLKLIWPSVWSSYWISLFLYQSVDDWQRACTQQLHTGKYIRGQRPPVQASQWLCVVFQRKDLRKRAELWDADYSRQRGGTIRHWEYSSHIRLITSI